MTPEWETLFARRAVGVRLGLEAVRAVFEGMGAPAGHTPAVHVVGTNGKGTTAALVAHALGSAGLRVGLFTSPHLHRVGERVRVDGEPVADHVLLAAVRKVTDGEGAHGLPRSLSFFELLTLGAMQVFADAGVRVIVAECGLGGRLDATRIVNAHVTAVASISFDHQGYLGPTLTAIAHEKGGAFRGGIPVVSVPQAREVQAVLTREAARRGTVVQVVEPLFVLPRGLAGDHHRANAALALAAARHMEGAVTEQALDGVCWPGRLEQVSCAGGAVLLDVAHNEQGTAALARHLEQGLRQGPPATAVTAIIVGTLADKPAAAMAARLARVAPVWWVPPPDAPAGLIPPGVTRAFSGVDDPDFRLAWSRALGSGGRLCVCGSHHLVAVLRARALGLTERVDPGDPLSRATGVSRATRGGQG